MAMDKVVSDRGKVGESQRKYGNAESYDHEPHRSLNYATLKNHMKYVCDQK